jgi:hypothetical protein
VEIVILLKAPLQPAQVASVRTLLREWSVSNRLWQRVSSTGHADTWRFEESFVNPPSISRVTGNELRVRLDGAKGGTRWRDWYAIQLAPFLERRIPEFERIVSVEDVLGAAHS